MDIDNKFEFKRLTAADYYSLQNDHIQNSKDRRMFLFWDKGYLWKESGNDMGLVFSIYIKETNVLIGSFSLDKLDDYTFLLNPYIIAEYLNKDSYFEDSLKEFVSLVFNNQLIDKNTNNKNKIRKIRCYTLQDEGELSYKLRKAGMVYKGVVKECLYTLNDIWEDGEQYEITNVKIIS